jgi:7,8-dihydroneopterin aldolase/epimerase/oxygenase
LGLPSAPGVENQEGSVDCIRLKGLTLFAWLGVTAWEKKGVQKVSCDVDLFVDLSRAAREDRIAAAVDYQRAYELIQEVARARKYHLIESLSNDILLALLDRFPSVERVAIHLRKTNLPFDAHLECVEVALERGR